MSQINFDSFRRDAPDLNSVWEKLEEWMKNHSSAHSLDPRRLAVDLYPVSAFELAKALQVLAKVRAVRMVYRVTDTNGTLLNGEYDEIGDIPDRLPDRTFDFFIDVKPSNIVPIFRIGATSEKS